MSRHYATKSFFRKMPDAFLARYFRERNFLQDFDFPAIKKAMLQAMPALSNWLR
jgi:hypothetical protein